MSLGVLGENALLMAVLQPGAASIDTHGNASLAGLVTVWSGAAPCHLRETAIIQTQGSGAEDRVSSVKETSLIVRLSQALNAAGLVTAGWEESATRVSVSDQRTTTPVIRSYRVVSSAIRAGGGVMVDSIRLSLWPATDA